MPQVRISLREGKSEPYRKALADGVHQAMVEAIEIPPEDRFQITTEHSANDLIYDPTYLGVQRSDDIVMVQITLSAGRKPAKNETISTNDGNPGQGFRPAPSGSHD
jgi:4-oxalocrotonate tautomerase